MNSRFWVWEVRPLSSSRLELDMGFRKAALGSSVLAFTIVLALVGCTPGLMGYREPEIAVNDLLRAQVESLPDGWTFEPVQTRDIWTKDITSARWAVWTAFIPKDPKLRGRSIMFSEEVHVFSNAFNAQVPLFEPMRALEQDKKQPLEGWSYRPPTLFDMDARLPKSVESNGSIVAFCCATENTSFTWRYQLMISSP